MFKSIPSQPFDESGADNLDAQRIAFMLEHGLSTSYQNMFSFESKWTAYTRYPIVRRYR